METIALYIGYIVIGLIALILVGALLLILYVIIIGWYRIIKYKQTIRFFTKHQAKDMYKACKVAAQFLISKGASPDNTLEEVLNMIENYRKRYKITENK